MSFVSPEAVWRRALAAHERDLSQLRAHVEERLEALGYRRRSVAISVLDADGTHVQAIVDELRAAGWVVTWRGDELYVRIPEDICNPPQSVES